MKFRLSRHAQEELSRRRIPTALVQKVLEQPEQIVAAVGGRKAYQSVRRFPDGKTHLLRVIVSDMGGTPVVVTVYRTSKVSKYWRAT